MQSIAKITNIETGETFVVCFNDEEGSIWARPIVGNRKPLPIGPVKDYGTAVETVASAYAGKEWCICWI